MDEEKEYNNVQTRQTVRPSMVVMTSKLLNISEGIAAMNIRIAIGVFLCLLLIVATFIVNVIAFNYAKDNEVKGGGLVDKSSGNLVEVVSKTRRSAAADEVELSNVFLAAQKNVGVNYGDHYTIAVDMAGFSILKCPSTVSEDLRTKYCQHDKVYLGYGVGDFVMVFHQDGAGVSRTIMKPEDKGFVTAALSETMEQDVRKPSRKLLHGTCHGSVGTETCHTCEVCFVQEVEGVPPECDTYECDCATTWSHSTSWGCGGGDDEDELSMGK